MCFAIFIQCSTIRDQQFRVVEGSHLPANTLISESLHEGDHCFLTRFFATQFADGVHVLVNELRLNMSEITTTGVKLYYLFEGGLTAVVHEGTIEFDVTQRRGLEGTDVAIRISIIDVFDLVVGQKVVIPRSESSGPGVFSESGSTDIFGNRTNSNVEEALVRISSAVIHRLIDYGTFSHLVVDIQLVPGGRREQGTTVAVATLQAATVESVHAILRFR